MAENSSKTKNIVYGVLAMMMVVSACLMIFLIVPMVKKVYGNKDGFEEKKLEFDAIRKDAADAKKFSDLVADLGQDQELVEEAVINEDSIVEFIREIELISTEVGNEIEIVHKKVVAKRRAHSALNQDPEAEKAKQEAAEKEKNTVRLEVIVHGNYRQFLEFFYKLENMTYVFNIESFKVTGSRSSGSILSLKEDVPPDWTKGIVTVAFIPKKSAQSDKEGK
ncbi:MAG: hypothetical protein U9O20_03300 [Patescibacteria group bacterium]|nr:hypothetical protein [Patescibacteria group bacterium]